MELSIGVVTVTYGNRWRFLQKVLERVLAFPQVKVVVVVDNASDYSVADAIRVFNDSRIKVISEAENKGSAGGYKDGISEAVNSSNADLIWLLDDDNLPKRDAAELLLSAWEKIEGNSTSKALFCFRADRLPHLRIAKGQNPHDYYLVPDNFMGFHVLRIVKNKLRKARNAEVDRMPIQPFVKMPYVPYGGFFMHRDMVKLIGTPNADFFVYADDSEYTYRVTKNGGSIWLVSAAEVIDIDPSQGNNYKAGFLRSPLLDLWNFRTYYQVRNRIYFYSRASVRNRILYKINQFLFMAQLFLSATLTGKIKAYKGFKAAVEAGHRGKLGKVDPIPGT